MVNSAYLLVLGLTCLSLSGAEETLDKLQVIFRHGYRNPITLAWTKNDTCAQNYHDDQMLLGNLTNLGKSQMSLLGYFLRVHYHSFIGDDPKSVQVSYSDCYRDLESAQLVYKALFQNFHPVTDLKLEVLNKTIEGEIATNDTAYNIWLESLPWDNHLRDQCKSLHGKDGMSCKNRTEYQNILDQMISEDVEGCHLPDWLTSEVKQNLQAEYNAVYKSVELCKSRDYVLHNSDEMLKRMDEVFKQNGTEQFKAVQLYASHDTNIAIILTRMGIFNSIPVPFGAALAFEQHTIAGKRIIRIFYDNSTDYSNFQKLKLPGCDWDCPYEKYVKIVTGTYPCSFATRREALGFVTMTIMSTMVLYIFY